MKRNVGLCIFIAAFSFAPAAFGQSTNLNFTAPKVVYASDISYPEDSGAAGMVTLCVSLDSAAHITGIQVVRDVPQLTGAALTAVSGWTFAPALVNGAAAPSTIAVDILFAPEFINPNVPLPVPTAQCETREAMPVSAPQILSASYAQYPSNTVDAGTVVFDVRVSPEGRVYGVNVIQSVVPLTIPSSDDVMAWNFQPGTVGETPSRSTAVVVFVFPRVSPSIKSQ
jgi:hypothetical protein